MWIFLARSQAVFGFQNAPTHQAWKQFYSKRIFVGSFWTHTACCMEDRARAGRFMRRVICLRGRRHLHATETQADKSGARVKVIPETPPIAISIATSVSIFPWNIWGLLRVELENSPV